jgi:hypothetical protein
MTVELLRLDATGLERIACFLDDALVKGGGLRDWTLEDIRAMANDNQLDLWELRADGHTFGGAVSVMRQYPRRLTLDILLLGTYPQREADWLQTLPLIKNLARNAGATAITGTGRPGWARKLKTRETRVFEIDLTEDDS